MSSSVGHMRASPPNYGSRHPVPARRSSLSPAYNSSMMHNSRRSSRLPASTGRPLPNGPGPLNYDGSKLTIKRNDSRSKTDTNGRMPIRAVHTEKHHRYNQTDVNVYDSPSSSHRHYGLTPVKRSQSMTNLSQDLNNVHLTDTSSYLHSMKQRGSVSNLTDVGSNIRYDMLQKSNTNNENDRKVEELFESSSSTYNDKSHLSSYKHSTSRTSHPSSSSSKELITPTYRPSPANNRSRFQEYNEPQTKDRTSRSRIEDSSFNTNYDSETGSDCNDTGSQNQGKFRKPEWMSNLTTKRRSSTSSYTSLSNDGLVGLRNLGNTCFMNSILQCLSNTRLLKDYCSKEDYIDDLNKSSSMKGQLMTAFAELIQSLWMKNADTVNPSAFKHQIQKFAPRFVGYSQQDSQEFLRFLLEGLHDDINKVLRKPRYNEEISDDLTDMEKAREAWNRYTSRENSRIVDIFVGQLKSTLQCTVCRHCSVTFDPFWDLSLPIPKASKNSTYNYSYSSSYDDEISLKDCFKLFTKDEILDGVEKPTCSQCQEKRKCTKKLTIQKFPKILVLHLKRFSAHGYRSKLSTLVDYPRSNLRLDDFSATGCAPPYDLYGVSNHSGSTYGGHYTAYCKHAASDRWYTYDDTRVSEMSSNRVKSSQGYVLFYETGKSA